MDGFGYTIARKAQREQRQSQARPAVALPPFKCEVRRQRSPYSHEVERRGERGFRSKDLVNNMLKKTLNGIQPSLDGNFKFAISFTATMHTANFFVPACIEARATVRKVYSVAPL